jgi:hypothetical protein
MIKVVALIEAHCVVAECAVDCVLANAMTGSCDE